MSPRSHSSHARPPATTIGLLFLASVSTASPVWAADNDTTPTPSNSTDNVLSLGAISVSAPAFAYGTELAEPYAGGLVAPGVHMGVWGQQEAANVPFSVVGFTDKLVRNQQADTVADVLENSAAIQSASGYGNYAESYTIRGFKLNGDDLSFAGLYGVLPRQVVTTQFVERVELFKGASAFTNGVRPAGTGVGGSINLVPKTAREGRVTRLRLGYTSESHGEAALDVSRRFGESERFGVRVNLLHGNGEISVDNEEQRLTSAAIALDYQGERGHALLFLAHQKLENDGGRLSVTLGPNLEVIPEPPDASTNYTPAWSGTDIENTFGLLRGGYELTDRWTAYAAVGANTTQEYGQYSQLNVRDSTGDAYAPFLEVVYESQSFTGQFGLRGQFLTGPISHQINLAYSGLYRRSNSAYRSSDDDDSTTPPPPPNTNIYHPANNIGRPVRSHDGNMDDPNVRGRVRTNAIALSDTLGFFKDKLLITLGLRYQDIEIKNYSYAGELSETLSDDTLTPVYGVVYKPTRHISLYANHIEALQPGKTAPLTINTGTPSEEPVVNAGRNLGIAESSQNEIGVKYNTNAFGATLSLYSIEKPSAYVNNNNVYGYFGEQRHRGVEVSLYGEPTDGLRLLTSATWIDAELTQTQNGHNEGNTPIGVPQYRIVVGAQWDVPKAERWTLMGQVVHTGPQYADAANKLELDSWTRLDLGVRYDMPLGVDNTLVWRARVENVTDADYWANASGPWAYLNMGAPRTFKLSATVNF